VDDLWHDLRTASREVRPDWDLSVPGLREAWTAGDLSHFHGWDRRSPEQVAVAGGPVEVRRAPAGAGSAAPPAAHAGS
jgi:hypothetical protein